MQGFSLITKDKARARRKVGGVGVMKDKELTLDEMKSSHTLGGAGECHVKGRRKWRESPHGVDAALPFHTL